MKLMPSRRGWRSVYRRSRLYVPFVLLVLIALAVFLPLSPDWMRQRIEREIATRTGMDVSIGRCRVWIAHGRFDARDIVLRPRGENGPGLAIGSITVEGSLAELLAGDGGYPSSIELADLPPLKLRRADAGIEVGEPWNSLVGSLPKPRPGEPSAGSSLGATPTVSLRNVRIEFTDGSPAGLPDIALALETIDLPARSGPRAPIEARFRGTAIAESAEPIRGSVAYLPADDRLRATLMLDGVAFPFSLPGLDPIRATARGLVAEVAVADATTASPWIDARLSMADAEVGESSAGGTRWADHDLQLAVRAEYAVAEARLEVPSLRIDSPGIEFASSGAVSLRAPFPGEGHVRMRKIPEALLEFGENLAAVKETEIDADTSATIRLDVDATGNFGEPGSLAYRASLDLGGWRVRRPDWPAPLEVRAARVEYGTEGLSLRRADLAFGGTRFQGSAAAPLDGRGMARAKGRLSGNSEDLLAALRRLDATPAEILSANSPLILDFDVAAPASSFRGGIPLAQAAATIAGDAVLQWGAGTVALRRWREPLHISSGVLSVSPARLECRGLRVLSKGVSVSCDVSADGSSNFWTPSSRFAAHVVADGPISEFAAAAEPMASGDPGTDRLLALAQGLGGTVRIDVDSSGTLGDIAAADYRAEAWLTRLSGNFDIPDSVLRLDSLTAHAVLDPQRLDVSRFEFSLFDKEAEGAGSIVLDDSALRVALQGRGKIGVAARVSPKDLEDLTGEGWVPFDAEATLTPRRPLEPGIDVVRRWLATLVAPDRAVGIEDNSPLRLKLDARLLQDGPVSFFHRDFPHPISNIKGDIRADEHGFRIVDARCDFGDAKGVRIRGGRVALGSPVHIDFERIEADFLDVNQWMSGWGEQPWAARPFVKSVALRPKDPRRRLLVSIGGRLVLRSGKFLSVNSRETTTMMLYEAWRNDDNTLSMDDLSASVYDGSVSGSAKFRFPEGKRMHWIAGGNFRGVDVHDFLSDLRGKPDEMVGNLTGRLTMEGDASAHETWAGRGNFAVANSNLLSGPILRAIGQAAQVSAEKSKERTTVDGEVLVKGERVYFPNVSVVSPAIDLDASGNIDFHANMDFDMTATVISKQLGKLPIVGSLVDLAVSPVLGTLGEALLRFHMKGTLDKPSMTPVALLGLFQKPDSRPESELGIPGAAEPKR